MTGNYDKQGFLKGSETDSKVVKVHLVRVSLNDHDHKCLAQEAEENHRVPSKELSHQVALRYKAKPSEGN